MYISLNYRTRASVDEYSSNRYRPHRQRSADVLCVSTSKLAMAFCVLGLIFIVAVIIAICCMFRAKMQRHPFSSGSQPQLSHGTSIFSLRYEFKKKSIRNSLSLFIIIIAIKFQFRITISIW